MADLKNIIKLKLEAAGFKEISFTNRGKLEGYEFLLSLYFPRTLRTIYFYQENDNTDNIIVEFVSMPQEWKGYRIYLDELDEFIKVFIVKSNSLASMSDGVWATWAIEKTKTMQALNHKSAQRFKYFLGYYDLELYTDLSHSFMTSPFVTNYYFNDASEETNACVWTCTQHRTWYSASILNYEGYKILKKKVLYYISGSYVPSVFNKSGIIGKVANDLVEAVPEDFPIDLVGAFDTIGFKQFVPPEILLETILSKEGKNWQVAFEALYFLLTKTEFKEYFSLIVDSPNIEIRNASAERAIIWKDADVAKKALKKGVSKQIEKELKANNLI